MGKISDESFKPSNVSPDSENGEKSEKTIIDTKFRTKEIVKKGSKLGKYSDLIVGKKGIFALLKYELITSLFSSFPGALGILLRGIFYRLLFKRVGRNVNFGKNITIRHPNKIIIGDNVIIDENCMLDAKGSTNEGIVIGNNCFIGRNSILSCKNGDIVLGSNITVGFNCELFSASKLIIGSDTLIAAYVYCIAGDHEYNTVEKPIGSLNAVSRGIIIEEGCWLGSKALILDGVKIGKNSIIGAAAVVNKDIPGYSIAIGIPASVVKSRKES